MASAYFSWVYKTSASSTAFFKARVSGIADSVEGSAGSCWGKTACALVDAEVKTARTNVNRTKKASKKGDLGYDLILSMGVLWVLIRLRWWRNR